MPTINTELDDKIIWSQFENRLYTFINGIFHPAKRIPILIISSDQNELIHLTTILSEKYDKQLHNYQFFFTIIPSPELLIQLKQLAQSTKILTLTSKLPNVPLMKETKVSFEYFSSFIIFNMIQLID